MSFSEKLRQEMSEQGLSIYRLARMLDPKNPWTAERNLYRWLADEFNPSPANREAVARALGREPDFFVRRHMTDSEAMRFVGQRLIEASRR